MDDMREKAQPSWVASSVITPICTATLIFAPSAMSKRKVNFGAIASEVARRQLVVPTPCWGRVLITPEE